MGFNFGAFGGGLGQGINNGIALGRQVQATIDEQNIRDLQQQGMKEAQAAREQAIGDSIKQNGLHGAADPQTATGNATAAGTNVSPALGGLMAGTDASQSPAAQMQPQTDVSASGSTPTFSKDQPSSYTVGGKQYDDFDSARSAAEKNAPSTMDLFVKNTIPRVSQMYLAQGDAQRAQAWQDWAEKKQNQDSMHTWAQAYQAAQMGDMDTATDLMVKLYDKVDDGISVVKKTPKLGQDGQLQAYTITLKQDKTGKTWDQEVTPQALMQAGMAGLSPDKQFEMKYQADVAANSAKAKAASEAAHDARVYKQAIALAGIHGDQQTAHDTRQIAADADLEDKKHGNRMEEDTVKAQVEVAQLGAKEKAKVNAKVDALRAAGYGDDDIKGFMPMLLNADSYKKPTSPGESRRMAFDARMKGDFSFASKSPEDQQKIIDGDMAIINGGGSPSAAAKTPNPFANPAAGGLPAPTQKTSAKGKGIPVYDTKTGQIVYQ
ncbi:hypothetical protein [Paraburkholderia terrae]|uniref:hypothetical protein n=1 Tax=Paraburkholderia terrae TaxID=311230 RepID=UPI001EE34BB9|nr:hypothetical protein [Paraburkholderia terrae]GJH00205.1 hypothetical protein CBA19C8_06630 [Paraburkholderia terrae]